jgi:hypothetical protein
LVGIVATQALLAKSTRRYLIEYDLSPTMSFPRKWKSINVSLPGCLPGGYCKIQIGRWFCWFTLINQNKSPFPKNTLNKICVRKNNLQQPQL